MEYTLFVCDADGKVHEFPGGCFVDVCSDGHKVLRKVEEGVPECFASFMRDIKWYKYGPAEPSFQIVQNMLYEPKSSNALLKIGIGVVLLLGMAVAYLIKTQMG